MNVLFTTDDGKLLSTIPVNMGHEKTELEMFYHVVDVLTAARAVEIEEIYDILDEIKENVGMHLGKEYGVPGWFAKEYDIW
jgi:hypothetical protein